MLRRVRRFTNVAAMGKAAGGGTLAASFRGAASADNNATTRIFSIDLGPATSDRLIVAAVGIQASGLSSSIVIAGTTITTPDVSGSNGGANSLSFYSSLIPAGSGVQTITVNGVTIFEEVGISVWACTGLSSNTVKNSNYQSNSLLSINVSAGDFLFAMDASASATTTFSGSTQTPTASHVVDSVNPNYNSADWISIAATNAAFSVVGTAVQTTGLIAATYR
jgi:hypothetical protein